MEVMSRAAGALACPRMHIMLKEFEVKSWRFRPGVQKNLSSMMRSKRADSSPGADALASQALFRPTSNVPALEAQRPGREFSLPVDLRPRVGWARHPPPSPFDTCCRHRDT